MFDIVKNIKNKIAPQYILCLISGVVCGFITHFYMLTHKLPNWDDVNNSSHYGSGDFLGRWFLKFIHPIGGSTSMPAVHGFLAILILSIAACFILKIMTVKSMTVSVLVPSLIVTFPSLACTMTFMFMAHTSAIAILMICLAVFLLREYKYGCIPACVLLTCSMGIYQSYMSFAITLMLMGMIMDLFRDKPFGKVVKQGLICVGVLLVSVVVYMKLCYVFYPTMDTVDYGGISEMGQINIPEVPIMIARCYKRFLEYFLFKPFSFVTTTMYKMNIAICVLAVFLFLYIVCMKKIWRNKWSCLLIVILCAFLPLAVAFVYFMAPSAPFSMLMLYAYVLIYVMVVGLLEVCFEYWEKNPIHKTWKYYLAQAITSVTVVVVCISCHSSYLLTNKAYLRMEISYERVTSFFNRILTRVEETEGFCNGDPVAILGEFYYATNPASVEMDAFYSEDLREMSGVALENGLITSGVRDNFIKTYIGFDVGNTTFEEKEEIMQTKEFVDMPNYPKSGSIKKINGVWTVKLCETIPNR